MPAVPRLLAASLLAVLLAVPSTASAHGPTECTSGPTRLASADAPAIVDAHGDTIAPWATPYGPAADLIGSWVTGPSAWADASAPQKFVAHMRVEAFDRPPVLARYYFVFSGAGGERWVRAVFDAVGNSWSFAFGTYEGTTYSTDGPTTGSVDTTTGVISIDLPKETLPTRPSDGKALDLTLTAARSFFRHEPLPTGGNLRLVDEAPGGDCTVTLYEAAPIA